MTPRQAVEGFYDRIWNRGDKAAIPELPRFHLSRLARTHHDGPRGFFGVRRRGDQGTGRLPTGRRAEWVGAALFTLKSDKIADLWVLGGLQGLREQLQRNAKH